MSFVKKYKYELALFCAITVATLLRFYGLAQKSLWYDELYTANEASPYISFKQLFYYCKTDQHPPLFFLIQRFAFSILGYTDWAARSVAAFTGVLSVWAMYALGKEIAGKKLGLIAALLTAINLFNIHYSHEARPYTLIWILTTLSYLYFIRTFKTLRTVNCIGYIIVTMALLYTSYFGFLVMLCQAIIGIVVSIKARHNKLRTFLTLLISGLVVIAGFMPWMPYFLKQTSLHPYWIGKPSITFIYYYYKDYFGTGYLLLPFLFLLPLVLLFRVCKGWREKGSLITNDLLLGSLFIVISVLIPYTVLYLKSVLQWPSLHPRYTTVVLPGVIIMLAYSFLLVNNNKLRYAALGLFLCISVDNLIWKQHFFSFAEEHPNRKAVEIMAQHEYPVVNQMNAWQLQYYVKKFNYKGVVFSGNKYRDIYSILKRVDARHNVDTFWVFIGHCDGEIGSVTRERISREFFCSPEYLYNNLSLKLYMRKSKGNISAHP